MNMKQYRTKYNINQTQLAKELGLSRETISRIEVIEAEDGHITTPTMKRYYKMLDLLDRFHGDKTNAILGT